MSMRVERRCKTWIPFNAEKTIQRLLKKVPQEHLAGLDAIIVVDQVTHKESRESEGIYWKESAQRPATIEIAENVIYRGMPKFLFFLPFVAKFMLASVLYHEIGHHYQRLTHEVKKEQREKFAEAYKKQMLRKAFFWWRLFLLPLAPLVQWLNRMVNKERLSARS